MKKIIINILWFFVNFTGFGKMIRETRDTQTPITLRILIFQKIFRINASAYWPMSYKSTVIAAQNVYAGIDTAPGYSPGCYIQGGGKLFIGDYTQIGPNVGLISSNHDLYDTKLKIAKTTRIGKYCWIGMGSVVLPGVELGDFTIVAAGTIVTKSFKEGYCIIAGNPAKKIKDLQKDQCIEHRNKFEYNGYIKSEKFNFYREKNKVK
jgi:acetyltransferase-like isoleucine patch superfamily enzyme